MMTVRQRSHLAESHFALAFVLMQDQYHLCESLSVTMEWYGAEVEEYKKKVNDLTSLADSLEAEVERQSKEVEAYKKNHEAERPRTIDLEASRARAEEKYEKLRQKLEKKKEEINMFYVQQKS
ncbi:Uncharacterized protein Fot_19361 [Forsythia ovata]|uniref:Uncharacterized protein n=1 Tax=Forsythia ovata TaxID=205694 RepID=A0ABD1VKU6_9LAMI